MTGREENGDFSKAERYAVRLLGVRSRSKKEILDRLKRRGFECEVINAVLTDLEKKKLVDDLAFSVDWINSRMRENPRGRRYLRWELQKKGVPSCIIEEAFERCGSILDEERVLRDITKKYFVKGDPGVDDKKRVYRKLCARGFDPDVVSGVLGMFF